MKSVRVIPVSAVLVPYEWLYLQKWVTPPLFGTAPQWPACDSSRCVLSRRAVTVRINMVMLTERRKLGKSSISLPPLGFGCAPIGEIYDRITDEEARASFLCPQFIFQATTQRCGLHGRCDLPCACRCKCRPRPPSKERLSWECGTSMSLLRTARDSLRCGSAALSAEQPTTLVPYACHAPTCL